MGRIQRFILDVSRQRTWYHRAIYRMAHGSRSLRLPFAGVIGSVMYNGRIIWLMCWRRLKQLLIYEPMLRYRCKKVGHAVSFEVNFPLIMGYGSIELGDRVRIGGNVNLIAAYKVNPDPTITVGNDVYLGYETTLSCAERITIGNRVLVAERATILDNNNHPLDPKKRAANATVGKEDISAVHIDDDVWIGAGATILKGVTIGYGAVVATGAVVTKNIPPLVVVAGNPARIVKNIATQAMNR